MKKVFLLILLLILSHQNSYTQTGWFLQNSGTTKNLNSSSFINENTGWVAGNDGIILKTTNGGMSWVQQYSDTIHLTSVSFYNEKFGWAAGATSIQQYPFHPYLNTYLKTTNGGQNWIKHSEGSTNIVNKILMLDSMNVIRIAAGVHWTGFKNDGYIARSSDNGLNWTFVSTESGIHYYGFKSLDFINKNTGWAIGLYGNDVGQSRRIYLKTTNAGLNWSIIRHDSVNFPLNYTGRLQFLDENTGYLLYEGLIRTDNGGLNWSDVNSSVKEFYFINPDTGWITNFSGQVYRTNNGGNSWTLQIIQSSQFNNINFVNENTGWIVGNAGVIMKTVTGGLTNVHQISSSIPSEFSLSQNFPNPFNPSTNIKFSLPKTQHTILKVFDIAGREVATLVNETLQAGEYSYEFRITKDEMGSGVYFYQLRAGEFVETKKMILIK